MRTLTQKPWVPESRSTTVCIDSYQDGIFRGRFYGPDGAEQLFLSLSRFLVMMEQRDVPQSDTSRRSFSSMIPPPAAILYRTGIPRGRKATFSLQILFRRHTSWQGKILWQDRRREQSFRSVLELILLMDSALRETEEQEAG